MSAMTMLCLKLQSRHAAAGGWSDALAADEEHVPDQQGRHDADALFDCQVISEYGTLQPEDVLLPKNSVSRLVAHLLAALWDLRGLSAPAQGSSTCARRPCPNHHHYCCRSLWCALPLLQVPLPGQLRRSPW